MLTNTSKSKIIQHWSHGTSFTSLNIRTNSSLMVKLRLSISPLRFLRVRRLFSVKKIERDFNASSISYKQKTLTLDWGLSIHVVNNNVIIKASRSQTLLMSKNINVRNQPDWQLWLITSIMVMRWTHSTSNPSVFWTVSKCPCLIQFYIHTQGSCWHDIRMDIRNSDESIYSIIK